MSVTIDFEPGLQERAEQILGKIGMSFSDAVKLFTRQVIIRNSFPIELKAPAKEPRYIEDMTEEELDALLQEGVRQVEAGLVISAEDFERELREEYGINI